MLMSIDQTILAIGTCKIDAYAATRRVFADRGSLVI